MPAPCDMGNNYKRAVHLPSRKGWDGRKLKKKNRRWVQVTKRNFSLKCRKMRTQQYRKQHAFVDREVI